MATPSVMTVGPGVLTIGDTTGIAAFDKTCKAAKIVPSVNKGEPTTVLNGDVLPGKRTETYQLELTLLDDFGKTASNVEWLWEHSGELHPFTYQPNNDTTRTITGELIVDPIAIGGDVGSTPEQSVTLDLTGKPTFGTAA